MKFNLNQGKAVILSALLLCGACGDADLLDTDKWSSKVEGWEPGVTLKVMNGSFSLWDLINQGQDSVIVKDEATSLLAIRYVKEDIYTLEVDEVFSMPEQGQEFKVTLPGLGHTGVISEPVSLDFPLTTALPDIPSGCELTSLALSGDLNCAFPHAGFDYQAEIEFENITVGGSAFTISKRVTAADQTGSWTWSPARIQLDGTDELRLKLRITVDAGADIADGNGLKELKFWLTALTFEEAEGKIRTDAPIAITPGDFDMDVDFLNEIGGTFRFTNPEIALVVRNNGIGVPMQLEGVEFSNQGETLKLNAGETLEFGGNPVLGTVKEETASLNKDNSNIVDFISLPPTGNIGYEGRVVVNPGQRSDNKVYKGGKAEISAAVRIPFSLSAEELTYRDTLTDIDVDEKIADKILEGQLHMVVTNELPLTLSVPFLVLMDESNHPLDTVRQIGTDNLIPAVKADGTPAEGKITFELKEKQAKKLSRTKNILLEAVASTRDNQAVDVNADAKLSFYLKVAAKASIEDFDDF